MEHVNFPVKVFAGLAFSAALLVSACNDSANETSEVISDSNSTMIADSSAMMPMPASPDSTAMMSPSDSTGIKRPGAAKPNATLKGKKGKVSIIAPASMSGPMTPNTGGVYSNVDYIPSFPGGNAGLQKYFDDNLNYPSDASAQGVEGTVKIAFTIDESGKLISPSIEGANEGYGLDEEALRVVRSMPAWNPGKIKGKPVKTRFVLPVNFQLNQ